MLIKKIAVFSGSLLLLAAINTTSTYSWLTGEIGGLNSSTAGRMGTVKIELSDSGNGTFSIDNNSSMPVVLRVNLIPMWIDDGGRPTIEDTSDIEFASESPDWTAANIPETGGWFLVYTGGRKKHGYGTITSNETTLRCDYTYDAPNPPQPGYTLSIELIAESLQGTDSAVEHVWSAVNM